MSLPQRSTEILDGLAATAEHAIKTLRDLGVDHAEVSVGVGKELEVSVRQDEPELVKEAQSSGLSVRVMRSERVATSSTTDLGREAVEAFLKRAVEMAEISEPDPLATPPDPSELASEQPELDLFDPQTDGTKADDALRMAQEGERAAFGHDKRITTSEGATFSRSSGHTVLATTGGFVGRRAGTYQSLVVQAVADDSGGKKRNGVYWTGGRFMEALEAPAEVGAEAARRAIATLGAAKMDTGVYPVVFDKDAARALVGLVASCILGDAVYRQRSYLAGRIGETIGSDKVTIVDNPLLPRAPGSRPFDGEGRPVRQNVVVDRGKLASFLLDTYSARKLDLQPTGSAGGGGGIPHSTTSNLYLKAGDEAPEALLKGIDKGLFVTRMMGFGFNPVTGDFSRGAEGFLIENGELGRPIGEITVSRNLDEILKGIDAVANDLEHKTSISAPTLRVDQMTIAGA